MPTAKLKLFIPEDIWMGKLSRENPDTEFKILTAFPKDIEGVALAKISTPDGDHIVTEMRNCDEVLKIDVLKQTEKSILVQFETSEPNLLLPVREAGTPLELPFTIQDGTVDWEVTATQDRLSDLATQLRELDIRFDVQSVLHDFETTQLLTDKQRKVLTHAVENGYYDTPRGCSLTELAAELDLAKSTCSETLHRAEERIIKQFTADTASIDTESMPLQSQ